jgi:hypothetical protein
MNVDISPATITGSQAKVNQRALPLAMQFVKASNKNGEIC